jgi:DNA polymerase-3 subunit epsilon
MTRGQESLIIEVELAVTVGVVADAAQGPLDLIVVMATDDELAAHAQQLESIAKASKGLCLWHQLGAA